MMMTMSDIESLLEQYRQALILYAAQPGEAGSVARMVLAGEDAFKSDGPYLSKYEFNEIKTINPDYPVYAICECGHEYYRHFDPYEDWAAVGCKYCRCDDFRCEAV